MKQMSDAEAKRKTEIHNRVAMQCVDLIIENAETATEALVMVQSILAAIVYVKVDNMDNRIDTLNDIVVGAVVRMMKGDITKGRLN